MKIRLALAVLSLASLAVAQGPPPINPPFFDNPGSQTNTSASSMAVMGFLTMNGVPMTSPVPVVGPAQVSVTAPFVTTNLPGASVEMNLDVTVRGAPQSPFTLAVSVLPGPLACCSFGPWLPGTIDFPPLGLYHLDLSPLPVIDSLGLLGPPFPSFVTDSNGEFSAFGVLPLNTTDHFAVQAVVTDLTAPLGFSLTAALAIPKYQ